jgi:hypothetical protein
VDSSDNDATALIGAVLPLSPRFLRLPQEQQHIVQQQLVTRLLIAQDRNTAEHEEFVVVLFFDVPVVVGGEPAWATGRGFLVFRGYSQ